jgi:hypothetical protein
MIWPQMEGRLLGLGKLELDIPSGNGGLKREAI